MKNGGRKLNAEGGLSEAYVGKGLGARAHADLTVSGNFKREEVNASSSKLHAGPANHSFTAPRVAPLLEGSIVWHYPASSAASLLTCSQSHASACQNLHTSRYAEMTSFE